MDSNDAKEISEALVAALNNCVLNDIKLAINGIFDRMRILEHSASATEGHYESLRNEFEKSNLARDAQMIMCRKECDDNLEKTAEMNRLKMRNWVLGGVIAILVAVTSYFIYNVVFFHSITDTVQTKQVR